MVSARELIQLIRSQYEPSPAVIVEEGSADSSCHRSKAGRRTNSLCASLPQTFDLHTTQTTSNKMICLQILRVCDKPNRSGG